MAWPVESRQARQVGVRHSKAQLGMVWLGRRGEAGRGKAGCGSV